jgi:hypothetical protein
MTSSSQKNAMSVMKDIFEMNRSRDPVGEEMDLLLESWGTHGSLFDIYGGGWALIRTKKVDNLS